MHSVLWSALYNPAQTTSHTSRHHHKTSPIQTLFSLLCTNPPLIRQNDANSHGKH